MITFDLCLYFFLRESISLTIQMMCFETDKYVSVPTMRYGIESKKKKWVNFSRKIILDNMSLTTGDQGVALLLGIV